MGQGENKYFKTRGTGELKKISNGESFNLRGGLSFVGRWQNLFTCHDKVINNKCS